MSHFVPATELRRAFVRFETNCEDLRSNADWAETGLWSCPNAATYSSMVPWGTLRGRALQTLEAAPAKNFGFIYRRITLRRFAWRSDFNGVPKRESSGTASCSPNEPARVRPALFKSTNACLAEFADLSTSLRSKTCDERFRIELKSINRYTRLSGNNSTHSAGTTTTAPKRVRLMLGLRGASAAIGRR
jgi:hypothetical protein